MKGKLIILKADGKRNEIEVDGRAPSLKELQNGVGGYIELVPMFKTFEGEPCFVFCNEEGKLNDLPFNEAATVAWANAIGSPINDVLVGDVVICQGDEKWMKAL